jgi:hypothetical protein
VRVILLFPGTVTLIKYVAASRTRFLIPHFPFPSPSAGEVDKIVLPEGMQEVNFSMCEGITGTAESLG